FKIAAEELNITPTAVSHQVRNLEDKLGTSLFERKTRAVALTQEGARIAEAAHQSLKLLATTLEEASNRQSALTVSTTGSFAALCLAPRIEKFHHLHPEIQVKIQTGEQLVDFQRDKQIDVAIRYGDWPEDENAKLLATEYFGVYGTASYLSRMRKTGHVVLLDTSWKNENLKPIKWQQWLAHYELDKEEVKVFSYDQELHVIHAALASQGLALISSLLAETAVQQKWLQPYKPGCVLHGFRYYLLTPKHSPPLPKVTLFRGWLLDEFSPG
ncbi:MAG: LysR substrate-binding domain-containing protein, partial [Pseudomonadota bacterium]